MNNGKETYQERLKRVYEQYADDAKHYGYNILLEYSEENGMFHFSFVTDKETWQSMCNPSLSFMPIGYTTLNEYKGFREYASEQGLVFYEQGKNVNSYSSLEEVAAAYGNFIHSGGTVKFYKVIDNIDVPVCSREFVSANILSVTVGTTGYCGGDTGHGCRTVFSLRDESSTDIRCIVTTDNGKYEFTDWRNRVKQMELIFGGDCELDTFIQTLEYAVKKLKEMKAG